MINIQIHKLYIKGTNIVLEGGAWKIKIYLHINLKIIVDIRYFKKKISPQNKSE